MTGATMRKGWHTMGWYGTYGQTITECVRELTESAPWTDDSGNVHERVTIAKTYRGGTNGTLYAVQDRIITSPEGDKITTRFILVALIRYSREQTLYKDMDCCMGPAVDSCPLKYVELLEAHPSAGTDHHGQFCQEWRDRIRAKATEKAEGRKVAKALKHGDYVMVAGFPEPFRVEGHKTARRLYVSGNGYTYAHVSTSRVIGRAPEPSAVGSYTV